MHWNFWVFAKSIHLTFCYGITRASGSDNPLLNEMILSGKPENQDCCRICEYKNTGANGSQNAVKYEQLGMETDLQTIHMCSLIQLRNHAGNTEILKEHFLEPAHIFCSLFLISIYANIRSVCTSESRKDNIELSVIQFELDWLRNVIQRAFDVSGNSGTEPIMIINGIQILPGAELEGENMATDIISYLPDFGKNYIIRTVFNQQTNEDNSITLPDILSDPYWLYRDFYKNIDILRAEYNSDDNKNMIKEKINKRIGEIFDATTEEFIERDPLEIIYMIQLIGEKQIKLTSKAKHHFYKDLVNRFQTIQTKEEFQTLIQKVIKSTSEWNGEQIKSQIMYFVDFIKKRAHENLNLKLKVMNFWLAKVLFRISFIHMPFVCYNLFKEGMMNYSNTYILVHRAIIIRRMFFTTRRNRNCTVEKWKETSILKRRMTRSSFNLCNKLRQKIQLTISELPISEELKQAIDLNDNSVDMTYRFLKKIDNINLGIINMREEKRKKQRIN